MLYQVRLATVKVITSFAQLDRAMGIQYSVPEAEIRPCKQVRQIANRKDRRAEQAVLRTQYGRI